MPKVRMRANMTQPMAADMIVVWFVLSHSSKLSMVL